MHMLSGLWDFPAALPQPPVKNINNVIVMTKVQLFLAFRD